MDRIHITNIRCYGYTGFLPEEQVLGQWFQVDLTIGLNLAPAGSSDDLNQTLDYRQAITSVKQVVEQEKFALVEKMADAISSAILSLDLVQEVRVKLIKLAAPIPGFGGQITIDITRTK